MFKARGLGLPLEAVHTMKDREVKDFRKYSSFYKAGANAPEFDRKEMLQFLSLKCNSLSSKCNMSITFHAIYLKNSGQ
jgi:hypothetical protein